MNEILTREVLEVNDRLDSRAILDKMGFKGEAVYEEGDHIRIYCPIHHDMARRSLIIDKEKRTYKCQHKQCPAFEGGALIQLFAIHYGISVDEALDRMDSGPKDLGELITEADRLIDRGELSSAMPILRRILSEDPKNEINRCKMAALYLELGDKDAGQKEYLRAAEDFAVRGELDKTVNIYKLLLMIAPDDQKLRISIYHIFRRMERFEDAIEQLKFVADQLVQQNKFERAMKVCQEMLKLQPAEPSLREFLAKLLVQQGDSAGAAAEAEIAARLYFELDRQNEARTAIEFGLQLAPNNKVLQELKVQMGQAASTGASADAEDGPAASTDDGRMSEDEFLDWRQSLEDELGEPETLVNVVAASQSSASKTSAESVSAPASAPAPSPLMNPEEEQALLTMFGDHMRGLNEEKVNKTSAYLQEVVEKARAARKDDHLSEREMALINNYYRTFRYVLENRRVRKS